MESLLLASCCDNASAADASSLWLHCVSSGTLFRAAPSMIMPSCPLSATSELLLICAARACMLCKTLAAAAATVVLDGEHVAGCKPKSASCVWSTSTRRPVWLLSLHKHWRLWNAC